MAESGAFKSEWEYEFGIDRRSMSQLKSFLDSNADKRATVEQDKIHPEMPHNGSLMAEAEELEKDGCLDSITWYRIRPRTLDKEISNVVKDYLGLHDYNPEFENMHYRDLLGSPDRSQNLYTIDGFKSCKLVGDREAVERATNYLARNQRRGRFRQKAETIYEKIKQI